MIRYLSKIYIQTFRRVAVTICSFFLALVYFTGALDYGVYGCVYWVGAIALTVIFLCIEFFNCRYLSARYLLKGRIAEYYTSIFLLSFGLCPMICGVQVFQHNSQQWIIFDIYGNLVTIFLLFLLTGVATLFKVWEKEMWEVEEYSRSVSKYVDEVKRRLHPLKILQWLDIIIGLVQSDAEKARIEIQNLSGFLRHQLYELPEPKLKEIGVSADIGNSRIANLLIGKKFRWIRISAVQILLMLISANVFFFGPVQDDTGHRAINCLLMFGVLNLLYQGVRILFLRSWKSSQSPAKFLFASVAVSAVISSPVIAVYVVESVNCGVLHIIVTTLSILLNIWIFIAGIGGMMYVQEWLKNSQRMGMLRFMALQEEYYYLRKQINPHFLFNVLNNADLSSYINSDSSIRILEELRNVLLCQFDDTNRMEISVEKEIDRIKAYLSLESFRLENFKFHVTADHGLKSMKIPSLLFMTFIENAVKYSGNTTNGRYVNIQFRKIGKSTILFKCENSYNPGCHVNVSGGLGLANTIRRLDILYGNSYYLKMIPGIDTFKIELTLPPYVEMYNCR